MAAQHWTDRWAGPIVILGLLVLAWIMYTQYKEAQELFAKKK